MSHLRLIQWVGLGLGLSSLGLLAPARAENLVPGIPVAQQDEAPAPAKTLAEWQTQIAQAQARVTQVTVTPTATGLEIRLDTAGDKPLLVDASKFRREGNALVADIANATLSLADGQPFGLCCKNQTSW
jgi:hypothetical protein